MFFTPRRLLMAAALLLSPAKGSAAVYVSEIAASNKSGLTDENGAHSDWIELHNASAQAVNLEGWHLSDDGTRPLRWEFPAVMIPAQGYLVVYASGKDRASPGSPLHTDFKLAGEGNYLVLSNAAGVAVDEIDPEYPPQVADVSWGQVPGEPVGTRAYFYNPTPGALNDTASQAADPPVIGTGGTTFFSSLMVEIHASHPEALIFYTLDGSTPGTGSMQYSGPLLLNASTRLRAVCYVDNLALSPVRGENYLQLAPSFSGPGSNLPLMVLDNFAGGRPDNATGAAWMIFEPQAGTASLMTAPQLSTSASIKVRGSSTAGASKYSLAVEAQNEAGGDRDLPVLGLPEDSDWILQSPYEYDRALIRNSLMYALSNAAGRYAPRTRHVELYINTDGGPLETADYFGVYTLTEKIKRGSERVDVQEINPLDNGGTAVTGGYLLKLDRPDPGESGFYAATQTIYFVDPDEPAVTASQEAWLTGFFNGWWGALNAPDFYDPLNGYAKWSDPASFIDHHILNVAAKNVDALRLSAYFSKDRLGRLQAGPLWDFDRSLESTDSRDNNYYTWRGEGGDLGTDFFRHPWYNEMFRDPNFWQAWIDRYDALRRTTLSHSYIQGVIASQTAELTAAAARNFTRWPDKPPRFGGWSGEITNLQSFLLNRLSWMDGQFTRPPVANSPGGPVPSGFPLTLTSSSLNRPNTKIYYTTDGTDPRLFDVTVGQPVITDTFLTLNAPVKVHLPGLNPGPAWQGGSAFNDTAWWDGTQGVGYDDNSTYDPYISFNLEAPPPERRMKSTIQSCYLRYHFEATPQQIAGITFLKLRVRCDDGMAAWLNGVKLPVSIKEPASLVWNSGATTNTPDSEALMFTEFTIPSAQTLLVPGDNVLAVQGLNYGLNSSDFLIQLELLGGYTPPDGPEVSPTAIEYTGPISIPGTTHLIARTYDPAGPFTPWPYTAGAQTPVGSHWSAPLRLSLLTGTVPTSSAGLRVVEIMYHPGPLTMAEMAAGFTEREHFEYLVVQNVSTQALDLTGVHFTTGIEFTMPLGPQCVLLPGQRGVLVKNRGAFVFRYQTTLPILGEYQGNLDNAGETLTCRAAGGSVIFTALWDDANGWPEAADGEGFSIVHRGPSYDPDEPAGWRPSFDPNGELNTPPSFSGWQSAWFPAGAPEQGPDDDPDKDGVSNAAEFAAATNPLKADTSAVPVAGSDAANCLTLAVRRRPSVNAWVLESSPDTGSWTPVAGPPDITSNSDGSETLTWCLPKTEGRTYFRARAVVP